MPSNSDSSAFLSNAAIEAGWKSTFSTDDANCPCDQKSFKKAVDWALRSPHKLGIRITDRQIEKGWVKTFSTGNPFCPCDLESFTAAVKWARSALILVAIPAAPAISPYDGIETTASADMRLAILASFAHEVLMGAVSAEDTPAAAKRALKRVGLLSLSSVVALSEEKEPDVGLPALNVVLKDQLDVREMLEKVFGSPDVLLNGTGVEYLSDLIESLFAKRAAQSGEPLNDIASAIVPKSKTVAAKLRAGDPNLWSVVTQLREAATAYEASDPLRSSGLASWADTLELSSQALLEDIYMECCNAIRPLVDVASLPPSLVESMPLLVATFSATTPVEPVSDARLFDAALLAFASHASANGNPVQTDDLNTEESLREVGTELVGNYRKSVIEWWQLKNEESLAQMLSDQVSLVAAVIGTAQPKSGAC